MKILVLGMHRSGTSLMTRAIAAMGAYLGPEELLMKPMPDNPLGFWERQDVVDLNDAILASEGRSWSSPCTNETTAELSEEITNRLDELILRLDLHSPWAIKDPRLCLTLPLWLERIPEARVVLVHRNPLEIAQSLQSRDGLPIHHGLALWEAYLTAAVGALRAANVEVVETDFETLQGDFPNEIERIRKHLNAVDDGSLHRLTAGDSKKLLRPNLRHQHVQLEDLADWLSPPQARLHQASMSRQSVVNPTSLSALSRSILLAAAFEAQQTTKEPRTVVEIDQDLMSIAASALAQLQNVATANRSLDERLKHLGHSSEAQLMPLKESVAQMAESAKAMVENQAQLDQSHLAVQALQRSERRCDELTQQLEIKDQGSKNRHNADQELANRLEFLADALEGLRLHLADRDDQPDRVQIIKERFEAAKYLTHTVARSRSWKTARLCQRLAMPWRKSPSLILELCEVLDSMSVVSEPSAAQDTDELEFLEHELRQLIQELGPSTGVNSQGS